MKLILYARKSSEAEDQQAMSIPAQIRELEQLAVRQGHVLVGQPIEEAMSAKRPGRPYFGKMFEEIQKRKADGILCWHLYRLARNPIDGASVMWSLSERQIQAVVTPDRTYTGCADDKLMMSIIFGMATKYSDDLSKNVRRGYDEAAQRGTAPFSRIPVGYVRDSATKACVPDPARWEKVKELWRARLGGVRGSALVQLAQVQLGLKGRKYCPPAGASWLHSEGRLLTRAGIYKIFKDPFYAGLIRHRGQLLPGTHKPMITPAEFFSMQKAPPKTAVKAKLPLPYRGIFRCGKCGRGITIEQHVKRTGQVYVYYRCSGVTAVDKCESEFVPLLRLEQAIEAHLARIALPGAIVGHVLDALSRQEANTESNLKELESRRRVELTALDAREARLLEAFLAGHLTTDEHAGHLAGIRARRSALCEAMVAPANDAIELLKSSIFRGNSAIETLRVCDSSEKSALLSALSLNCTITDGNVDILAKEPFRTFAEISQNIHEWIDEDKLGTELLCAAERAHQQSTTGLDIL